MLKQKNQFSLTPKERAIEFIGVALFATVLIGSFLKVMFF
jgi:hypothetical protein